MLGQVAQSSKSLSRNGLGMYMPVLNQTAPVFVGSAASIFVLLKSTPIISTSFRHHNSALCADCYARAACDPAIDYLNYVHAVVWHLWTLSRDHVSRLEEGA
jgi:hypothetical protein